MPWLEFLQDEWWIVGAALALSLGSLLLLPVIVIRLPPDYFLASKRRRHLRSTHGPVLATVLLVLKNLLGLVLLLMGTAMLLLPGQGVLTMLTGLVLLDFPGKYRCERWLVSRGSVLEALNWLRLRRGKPALLRPGTDEPASSPSE